MRDQRVPAEEPTAALDAKSEAEVFARLKGILQNKTAASISHHNLAVRVADRILGLANASIWETATVRNC